MTLDQQKLAHQTQAKELFKLGKTFKARANIWGEEGSLIIDNMALKSLPKYRKDILDAWSKDKLIILLGGTYFDHSSTVQYYVYPELFNESANTILTQLSDSLFRLKVAKPFIKRITITFDNHATQKNYYIISWHMKIGFLPADGYFHVLYLVKGHTHTHHDAANKAPRMA